MNKDLPTLIPECRPRTGAQAKKEMMRATRKPTPPTSVSMMVQVLRVVFSSMPTTFYHLFHSAISVSQKIPT